MDQWKVARVDINKSWTYDWAHTVTGDLVAESQAYQAVTRGKWALDEGSG